MHICFISPCQFNEFTGGIDRVCCQLIREFSRVGMRLSSAFLQTSTNESVAGVSHHLFPNSNNAGASQNVEFLHQLILTECIDIVWLNTFVQGQLECVKLAVVGTCAKLVYTFHTDPIAPLIDLIDARDYTRMKFLLAPSFGSFLQYIRNYLKYPIGYFLRKKHLKSYYQDIACHCDLMTFLSNRGARDFQQLVGKNISEKCVVIRNPLDIEIQDVKIKKKEILFVGRLVWQKRVDRLLLAWKKLQNKFGDWKLTLVGDGPDKKLLQKMVTDLHIERVFFEGGRPSMEYYKNASIVCVPSSHEGFCLVAFEGIANSCTPVFFDSLHPLVELLRREHSVKSWSVDCLAKSLSATMLRFEKNKHSLVNGIEVLNKLTPEKIANKYIKEFQKLIR